MKSKLKIMDWYCHQSSQQSFFRTGHDFYLSGTNGLMPDWNEQHLSKNKNVTFIKEIDAMKIKFDVVIVRSSLNIKRLRPFIRNGAIPIAVVQVTNSYDIPPEVRHMVWNSATVMEKYFNRYNKEISHFYIVHGFDPKEYIDLGLERNQRTLSTINAFKERGDFLGYDLWSWVKNNGGNCDLWGHGNKSVDSSVKRTDSLEELIRLYNTYGVYFNPTLHSAMPRSRGEAVMCGMPLVSTKNYDIDRYFTHNKNAILSNDKQELLDSIKKITSSKQMKYELGQMAREQAVKYFHIDNYIEKWNQVFNSL